MTRREPAYFWAEFSHQISNCRSLENVVDNNTPPHVWILKWSMYGTFCNRNVYVDRTGDTIPRSFACARADAVNCISRWCSRWATFSLMATCSWSPVSSWMEGVKNYLCPNSVQKVIFDTPYARKHRSSLYIIRYVCTRCVCNSAALESPYHTRVLPRNTRFVCVSSQSRYFGVSLTIYSWRKLAPLIGCLTYRVVIESLRCVILCWPYRRYPSPSQ